MNCVGQWLAKNNDLLMSASLKNNESLEPRWRIQNTTPDFHLMGHIAAKLKAT